MPGVLGHRGGGVTPCCLRVLVPLPPPDRSACRCLVLIKQSKIGVVEFAEELVLRDLLEASSSSDLLSEKAGIGRNRKHQVSRSQLLEAPRVGFPKRSVPAQRQPAQAYRIHARR